MENQFKGKIIFSENYFSTIEAIKSINNTPLTTNIISNTLIDNIASDFGSKISIISSHSENTRIDHTDLNKIEILNLSAYDESILELNSLEGKVRCISHCVTLQSEKEYIPAAYVTLKFYTKSNLIKGVSNEFSDIVISDDLSSIINQNYIDEREYFLSKVASPNIPIFIDGSMFSGASTSGNFNLIKNLLSINCTPVFFVKNSESTIITERFGFAKGFNSDLHWAYATLKVGEVSPVFAYISPDGRSKAMAFIKIFERRSPIRLEFPLEAFLEGKYENIFPAIYYQYLANGSESNIQPRIIQITEMYAREILKSTNIYKEIERMGLVKSMNEERGF